MLIRLGSIIVGSERSENNHTAIRPYLSLGSSTVNVDTVVESTKPVTEYVRIALVGDAPGAITVGVAGAGTLASPYVVTFHYRTAVSTVTAFESAINSLASAYLRIRTAGTGANVLTATGDDLASSALANGERFVISRHLRALELRTDDSGMRVNVQPSEDDPSDLEATEEDYELAAGFAKTIEIGDFGADSVLSVYNEGVADGTVEVFGVQ